MRSLLSVLLASLVALEARAAEVYLDVRGAAAVSPEELAEAVAARASLARERGAGVVVVTVVLEPDLAVVVADGRVQRFALAGRSGSAAARVVAIGVTDLVARLPAVPPPRERTAMVALWPALFLGRGAPNELGLAADLSAPLAFMRAGLTLEVSRGGFEVGELGFASTFHGISVRAGAGVRLGPVELRAGPLATIDRVSGGDGHTGVRFGGAATGLAAVRLGGGLSLVVAAGVDVYARRTQFYVHDRLAMETPRVRPWGGIGLAWGWGR